MNTAATTNTGTSIKLQTLLEIWSNEMLRSALDGTSVSSTSTIALIRELHMGDIVPKTEEDRPWTQRVYGKNTKSYRVPTLPEHPIADAVEKMLTGPYKVMAPTLRDHTVLREQDLCLRSNRADFYLIICAEWLGMVPKWQPEAWRAGWHGAEFDRSVLAMHEEMRGWQWQRVIRGQKQTITEYRGHLARALGMRTKPFRRGERSDTYETMLYAAHTYLACLPWFQQLMFPNQK